MTNLDTLFGTHGRAFSPQHCTECPTERKRERERERERKRKRERERERERERGRKKEREEEIIATVQNVGEKVYSTGIPKCSLSMSSNFISKCDVFSES